MLEKRGLQFRPIDGGYTVDEIKHILWDGYTLKLLDQRLLPGKEQYRECKNFEDVCLSIKNMTVRGAPAIGVAAAFALVMAARDILEKYRGGKAAFSLTEFHQQLTAAADLLKKTRPTAVNLSWGAERILIKSRSCNKESPELIFKELEQEALSIYNEDIEINKKIGEWGSELIGNGFTILTHCNAGALATAGYGTALGIIRSAYYQGKKIKVFADETRPFLQGSRLTAWELQKEEIPVCVIVDSAAGYFINKGDIDCIIVGADRVALNGDVANKIGTYSLAVLAKENSIPFYVAAPLSTIDRQISSGKEIIVEERPPQEITHLKEMPLTPEGLSVRNPSFDITPARLISALITEYGIIHHPEENKMKEFLSKRRHPFCT